MYITMYKYYTMLTILSILITMLYISAILAGGTNRYRNQ